MDYPDPGHANVLAAPAPNWRRPLASTTSGFDALLGLRRQVNLHRAAWCTLPYRLGVDSGRGWKGGSDGGLRASLGCHCGGRAGGRQHPRGLPGQSRLRTLLIDRVRFPEYIPRQGSWEMPTQ
jgi:hypothetical protein